MTRGRPGRRRHPPRAHGGPDDDDNLQLLERHSHHDRGACRVRCASRAPRVAGMTAPLPPPESARLMAVYSAATAAAEWTRVAGLTGSPEAEKAALAFVRAAAAAGRPVPWWRARAHWRRAADAAESALMQMAADGFLRQEDIERMRDKARQQTLDTNIEWRIADRALRHVHHVRRRGIPV